MLWRGGRLCPNSVVCWQEAVEKLELWTPPVASEALTKQCWYSSMLRACWQTGWTQNSHNQIHPMPDFDWRRTDSSTEDSDQDDHGKPSGLLDAAFLLLEDTTLAAGTGTQELQPPSHGSVAAKNWEVFVEKCIAAIPRAAISSRLLAMRSAVPSPSARMVFQSQVSLKFG